MPTSASVTDIINGADQQAVIGMLAKFGKNCFIEIILLAITTIFFIAAADRSVTDSVADAKEGLVVSCVDTIETYRQQV